MIHRFIDIRAGCLDASRSFLWQIRRVTGGTNRTFAVAGCQQPFSDLADYLDVPNVDVNQHQIDFPLLSRDLQQYVYHRRDALSPLNDPTDLMIANTDDTGTEVSIAVSPITGTPASGSNRLMRPVGWSTDNLQVYYLASDNPTDDDQEFRRVDADGTNDTLILATSIPDFAVGTAPRISHDGTKIAYAIDLDSAANVGVWVMDSDGSNNARRYTGLSFDGTTFDFYGWSYDDEWLLIHDQTTSAPIIRRTSIIHPDGTGLTHIFEDTTSGGQLFTMRPTHSQHSPFVPDGSAVAVRSFDNLSVNPQTPGLLATDGSETFTPFPLVDDLISGPVLNYNGGRAYWAEGTGGIATRVVSCRINGSDYRVDDDMTDFSTTPQHDDYRFNGFFKNLV